MKLPIVAAAVRSQGHLMGKEETLVEAVSIDSRSIQPGQLFVCIKGERFDGHNFIHDVAAKGAAAIILEHLPAAPETVCGPGGDRVPLLLVDNALTALARLAHYHRLQSDSRVVGVTGTAGKTTIKELLAQVLSQAGETAKNFLNRNNQLGLPLSMLAATGQEKFWVMEAGISQPGDMDELGAILTPDLGVILNVGSGHTAGLGDRGAAHYKARFLAHLAKGGIGLINADYLDLVRHARHNCNNLIMFSAQGRDAPYRSGYLGPAPAKGNDPKDRQTAQSGRFRLWLDGETVEVDAPMRGTVGAENIIAVAAAAHLMGLSSEQIARGLSQATLPQQRFAMEEVAGWTLIDDTYNANPLSSERMINAAADVASGRNFILVMGEMGELGGIAEAAHQELGRTMGHTRARAIFWKGNFASDVEEGLSAEGWRGKFFTLADKQEAEFVQNISDLGLANPVVLFKGSRLNHLEHFLNSLKSSLQSSR